MDKKLLVDGFVKAVKNLKADHSDMGTYWFELGRKDGKVWAVVLGWSDGWGDPNDDCVDNGYRICAKIAYQPENSGMQCDYDVDWVMPFDPETNEVDDCDVAIYKGDTDDDLKKAVIGLVDLYEANYKG